MTTRWRISRLAFLSVALALAGCSTAADLTTKPAPATVPPSILTQPASVTMPLGLQGIFSVSIGGNGTITEQWYRNGIPIPSANSATYTTPAVTVADNGSAFTVTIANSLGSVTSQPAILTVGARPPMGGDLRFQQVDSVDTVYGYTGIETSEVDAGVGAEFNNAFGTPLEIDTGNCIGLPVPPNDGTPCAFAYDVFSQSPSSPKLAIAYYVRPYTELQTDLTLNQYPGVGLGSGPIIAPNSVVTSLSLLPDYNQFGLTYVKTSQPGAFDLAQHTVAPSQLQAAATQEGLASRVITAISYDIGGITYFSYGWTGDTATVYETLTATANFNNAGSVASSLAAQGYIITALGGDAVNNIVMVGTRVKGDTKARQMMIEEYPSQLAKFGYAVVGVVNNSQDINGVLSFSGIAIGER